MNQWILPRRQKKLISKYVFVYFSSLVSKMQHLKSSSGLSAILVHKNIYILVWDCMECHGGAYHACQWSHFIVFELICCYSLLGGNYVLWSTGHFLFLTGAYQHKLSVTHMVCMSANKIIFYGWRSLLLCKVCMHCLRNAHSWFVECMTSVCGAIWSVPCFLCESTNVKWFSRT